MTATMTALPAETPVRQRYIRDVLAIQEKLSYRDLPRHLRAVAPAGQQRHAGGLRTIAARTCDLPRRYLIGLHGFRLAQYLRLGWASEQTVYSGALFCEPLYALHPDDLHVVTLAEDSGQILGYVSMACSADTGRRDPWADDPRAGERAPFPCEVAHRVNVFDAVPRLDGVTTAGVRELKRFVHNRSLSDRTTRLTVTLELLLGLARALDGGHSGVQVFVGDVEEKVALRHLLLAGLDVYLVEGTEPSLPNTEVMHPMYEKRAVVKPFVAPAPSGPGLRQRIELMERTLAAPDVFAGLGELVRQLPGTLTRVDARVDPRVGAPAGARLEERAACA